MLDTENSTLPVEGDESQKDSTQATLPPEQSGGEPQDTGAAKVEAGEPQQPSNGEARKPSEFYKDRDRYRKRVDTLEATIADLSRQMASMREKPKELPVSPKPTLKFDDATLQKFYSNPDQVLAQILAERETSLREELKKEFMGQLPQALTQAQQAQAMDQQRQDAMELIFPKSGTDDKRSIKERGEADPERLAKFDELWSATGMDLIFEKMPLVAAQNFLKFLGGEKAAPPKNPNVIKKNLLGPTATGAPVAGGGKKVATMSEIKAQLRVLDEQVDKDPDVRYTDPWKQKHEQLKGQLSTLYKELGKGQ